MSEAESHGAEPKLPKFTESVLNNSRGGPQESEVAFRQIAEHLPAAIYVTDAAGRLTFYNEAAAVLWGRRPKLGEESWGGAWRLFRPDGSPLPHDECPMAITLKTGEPVRGVEVIAERPDGTRFPFVPSPTPLFNASGELIGAVNMLVDITEKKRAEEPAQHLAAVVQSSDDAIISKDLNGIIASWNEGAQRLFGYRPEEIIGKSVLTLIPAELHFEEPNIVARIRHGERIEHFETVRRRKDGSLVDISLTVSPVKNTAGLIVGASKIARDITERKRFEARLLQQTQRLQALNRAARIISQDLDLERIVQAVTDIARELSGAKFGAFFYKISNESGESFLLYSLSGAPREAFETFGMPRNTDIFDPTFRGQGIVRSDDIRQDPRYGRNAPHHGMPTGHLPVVSYLAVPVVSPSGEVIGGLFFAHDQPGIFTEEAESLTAAIASHAAVAIENARLHKSAQSEIEQRRRAEQAKELLLGEIKHRVKNTLATVQAMASQTFRNAPREERDAYVARLHALADAHDLLTQESWESVLVSDVARRALAAFHERDRQRFSLGGPDARLSPNRALLIAMALHELGTNAVKYGALSNDSGKISLTWTLAGSAPSERLKLCWQESGGPPVLPPARKGFGTRMIERALSGEEGSAEFRYAPDGLVCTIEMPL